MALQGIKLRYFTRELPFRIPAKTSRGIYEKKTVGILEWADKNNIIQAEISPLPDLSLDANANFHSWTTQCQQWLEDGLAIEEILHRTDVVPAFQFAFECAFLRHQSKNSNLFQTDFTSGKTAIPINGLVWMNDTESMEREAFQKMEAGFTCLKFKTGAQDHDAECRLIEQVRKHKLGSHIEIRLDANGAYAFEDALSIMRDFSKFQIHSIEQPIQAGQWDAMQEIAAKSKIPVALDEELIGIPTAQIESFLKKINPAYIIIKPTLLGGFSKCNQWIRNAEQLHIGWWATSALESNIGLGHIAQWVSTYPLKTWQGLGTGNLFTENFPSQIRLEGELLWFENHGK